MTVEMQQREQHQQRPPQPDQRAAAANRQQAAQQRDNAAAVNTAVTAARVERTRARHLGADKRRLAEAFELLSGQINGRDEMAVLEPGNVLRHGPGTPEQGTGNMAAVCEFVARIMDGQLPFDAIEEMHEARLERHLAPAVRHADATYQRAHHLENAAVTQPALPSGMVPPPSNGAELPRRRAGASLQGVPVVAPAPMFPPAPPETAVQSTGKIALGAIEAMIAEGHEMSAAQAALEANGYAGPAMGPAADPAFNATAIPQQRRLVDTVTMNADEVLAGLGADGVSKPDVENDAEPRPFGMAASTAAGDSSRSDGEGRSGGGGDDD